MLRCSLLIHMSGYRYPIFLRYTIYGILLVFFGDSVTEELINEFINHNSRIVISSRTSFIIPSKCYLKNI